ncbi:MAG: curlin minor subunit CsgB [Candidatus Accumulibacter phosphatis]|uniref:Curlin minor subunit CsgB n=2 Tax=Candidatus Accumulibacter TaxID=327159 RepID=A0A080LUW2_9PROT|nr:MAG: curlin minor subunit CsgB [Candidatus Accumulibacter phosphatis]
MLQQDNTGDVWVSYSQKGNGNAAEFSQIDNRGNASANGGQYGDNNHSTIQQSGNGFAYALALQGDESNFKYAIGNAALITQTFNQTAWAFTRQLGTLNDISITQQSNADVTAIVNQGASSGPEANSNRALILQNQNLVTTAIVNQGGTGNIAGILQEQNSNTSAEIRQGESSWMLSSANNAQILQTYNLNTIARVTQNGEVNQATITQSYNADNTIAEVVQGGGYFDRDSGQWVELGSGSQNQASIGQSNSHNVDARITQEGSLNTASVLQMGSDLVARIAQSGSSNQAAIDQLGIGFQARVTQNGMANVANVYQR